MGQGGTHHLGINSDQMVTTRISKREDFLIGLSKILAITELYKEVHKLTSLGIGFRA